MDRQRHGGVRILSRVRGSRHDLCKASSWAEKETKLKPSILQLQLVMMAPLHRYFRRRTEPHFNLGNNLLMTHALALALVGKIKQG
uniref:Uncharacterized protein n=1 Tax=Oryza brachyantha TaxID=4533 RepID=J3L061_ORYBR